ncbi:uncharacterized protein LOC122242444 isoform X4 [Penaeus japonicus]|uniref:uncharacterized protein LOC122242444 isoform X4 n=1 Tax=Penaeus japonicus TaxID=27405 RepID=UPI001C70B45B|nr:uncharacterized protein LOC122242444 isoform X4 [Penaeus japonicus]
MYEGYVISCNHPDNNQRGSAISDLLQLQTEFQQPSPHAVDFAPSRLLCLCNWLPKCASTSVHKLIMIFRKWNDMSRGGTKPSIAKGMVLCAALLLDMSFAGVTAASTIQGMKQGSLIELKIKELHKVMRDDDPSGRNQNMKVVLEPHPVMDADAFELTLILPSGQQKTYFLHEILDEDATEIEFEGNFEDSNNVIIKSEKDGSLVGFGSVVETITDLGSRVARVGDESAPSLRVDPGARDQVEVPGKPPCVKGSGPCYYLGQSEPPAPLCEDLPSIKFCDAIVSEAQNLAYVPTLELHNREELRVQPQPVGPKTEVVVSSTQDDSILSPDDLGCNDLGDDMCSQPVDIADDLESFDVTIVTLDDEGYVTESIAVLFEVHRVSTLSLSSDVLSVVVEPRSEGTYEVTLPGSSPPLELEAECQAGSPCRVWFAGVEAPASVSVKKESNVIFQDISTGPPPPSSKIERITSLGLDSKTLVEVLSDKPVTRADLVTFKSNVALDTDCETLPTTPLDSGYSLTAALHDAGEWNFIVVGYDDDGTLLEAGRVKVTLLVMDARVAVVGAALDSPDASLRVDVGSQDDVAIEGVGSCVKADSPCYFLTQSLTEDTLRYCVTITNSAGLKSQDVEQCDASFTPFKPMAEEPKLELIDGAKMKVTTEGSTTNNVEVIIFNLQTDDILSVSSPLCPPDTDGSCSQEVKIPEGLQEFGVLVVAMDGSGEVKESILSPFYDFMTSVQHFNDGTDLEVRWRASSEQIFSISIEEDVSGDFTKTSITCGREIRTCKAYFTKLSTGTVHWVKVTKDKTAVSISVSPHQDATTPLSIARISKVSTVGGQVQLTISSDTDVEGAKYLEYVVLEPLAGSESVQHIAFADFNDVIHTGNVITFEDVEAPKTNVEVTVMVIAHSDDGVDSDALAFGKALVTFEEIKLPQMTKVGTEAFQSLRVETSAMAVKVNGFTCPASTVCYYLEPENIKEPPEVCRMDNPDVEQCDMTAMYMVPEVLIDPSVQLSYTGAAEEDLIVAAEFSDTSIRMEAKLYTDTEDLTPEPLTCDITGSSPKTCVFKVEPQVTEFKILLTALSADSTVTKSSVVDFEDFGTRGQHFNKGADLEVRWRASSEQTFIVRVEEDVSGAFTQTSITCGSEIRKCKAYFTNLNTETVHRAKVMKDNTAVLVSLLPDQDAATPLSITRISKVSTVGGQVQLTISSDAEVEGAKYLEYVVLEPLAGSESVQHIAFADFNDVIHAGNVITFEDVEAPKTNVEVTVMVIAHSDDGVDSDALAFGKALVTFEEIKLPLMTKVGTEVFQSLRVETSVMAVIVNGFTCPASTVCYYLEPENIKEPPEVCRMANPTVEQCDMTAMFKVSEVLIDPSVQLSYTGAAEEDLIVAAEFSDTLIRMEAKLYTDTEDLTPEPLTCDITGSSPKTCVFKVEPQVTEFKILLTALSADSTVTKSSVVDFEDFGTRGQHFNKGADLEVRWRASSEQTFIVRVEEDVSGAFTQTSITCGSEIRKCKAYFTNLNTEAVHRAKVMKDNTAVLVSLLPDQDAATPLSITRISKVSTVRGQVQLTISSDAEVERAKYLEYVVLEPLSGSESVQHIAFADFNDVIHAGNVITFEDVEAPKTNVEVTVMVIAHSDDGVDSGALAFGKSLVTFEEIKLPQMTKVGTEAFQSLRVETSAMAVIVNGFTCPASTVCYSLEPENIKEPPEVCRMANPTVEQCDMTAMYKVSEILIDPSVQLSYTGAAEEDLIVAAEFSDTLIRMEAKLYTDTEDLTPEPLTCDITGSSPKTCVFKVEPQVTEFKILLTALSADSTVTKSSVVDFKDFGTQGQHFNKGADLEVRWRASSEQTFIVSVEEDVSGAFTQTSITCGSEIRKCKAYFTNLNTEAVHRAKVMKDNTAVLVSLLLDQDAATPLSITRISKVSTVRGQVQLTISSDTDVDGAKYLEYVVLEPLAGSESVQHIAFADFNDVIHAGNVITFEDVEAPKTNVEVTVMVIAHSDDSVDSDALAFGKALVTFEEIKLPQITKVGTEAFQSIRVETSAMAVKVNGFTCPASTICYSLEPENIKEPPEVCRMANPTVEQCDMTAMYKVSEVLIDPWVQLNYIGVPEEDLIVAAEFSETSIRMEAKLYTDTEDLTPEPLTCDITGSSPKTCVFKVEPQVTEFKILLTALSADSTVTKSSVVEFEDFQTRIQQLTADAIEVKWRASRHQNFDIEIVPEIEGSFSNTSIQCGGEDPEDSYMCLAYFICLDLNIDYTAIVRIRGDKRSVSAAVTMEAVEESINITELILTNTEDPSTSLKVCFMENQLAENNDTQNEKEKPMYRLVAMDASGRQVRMRSDLSPSTVSVVEDKHCLGPLPLDLDFDLSDKVRVLVTRENMDTHDDATGDVKVFLLNPREVAVKQVDKSTVQVRWTNSNKAPSFDVGTSSVDLSSVECGAGEEAERECLRYLHVENTNTPVTVMLREIGLSVQQEVQVEFTLKDLPDPETTSSKWLIVGSVAGCVVVLAVVASVFWRKKRK